MNLRTTVGIALLACASAAAPLGAQRAHALLTPYRPDAGTSVQRHDSTAVPVAPSALLLPRQDATSRNRRVYMIVGGAVGALVGAIAGNQYAMAHKPGCVNVPAGPPCQYLEDDNSNQFRIAGVALGAFFGLLTGAVLGR